MTKHIKKTTQLRNMINSRELEFIMEAHNGMSSRIVEEAGFKGIWASGLSISAALGVRDNNEASWTQVLDVVEFMNDAVNIPILLDGDTGYGNFNNMRRLVKKLNQRQVAGVCIEDKLFPKTNSFIRGESQPLADIEEFAGKIKAAKDTQEDEDFVVVARLEAFIAGWGLSEALSRAEAYHKAGADAILCHSKKSTPQDIEQFMKVWGNRCPVIIVPTKYYSVPTDYFRELGVSLVIWANHNIRTSVQAMKETTSVIFREQSLINVEQKIVSVSEIFRLQNEDELEEAEKKYLPGNNKSIGAVILAASQGNLGELTKDTPKTLLKVHGKSLLDSQIDAFNQVGIKDVTVVRGFGKQKITGNYRTADNDQHASTKELFSLNIARDMIKGDMVFSFGDIMFKNYILNDLLNDPNDITLIVDADCERTGDRKDFVRTDEPYAKKHYTGAARLLEMSEKLSAQSLTGEFIGLWKTSPAGSEIIRKALEELSKSSDFSSMLLAHLFNHITKSHPVSVRFIKGSWLHVDSIVDLQKAGSMA
ncbi:hypothetical protein CHS0354_027405 [Potamilus streckersoni]|uniref:phosphoenolpyruvate mutase n=1 Tax=Potamilus streckersoni TaxID=2493646 RepID=A0AAE0SQ96_9BIVA|nr:hypothetical protein CHS0354_027405 [Potamilus streckersoni]